MATVTGQRGSSVLPLADTPQHVAASLVTSAPASLAEAAAGAWRSVTPSLAGTPHVRISKDGGRTYPARWAGPLPAEPPQQPCTVAVYDPGRGAGRLLALDLDPGRCLSKSAVKNVPPGGRNSTAGVDSQTAELGQLLERLGGRYVADVAPGGGRHVYVLFSSPVPWLELRDLVKAVALRFPAVDHGPHDGLGGQISPPGARHKSGGWRLLSMPLEVARAAVENPCGPEVWAGLLAEFAAELQQVEVSVRPADTSGAAAPLAEFDDTGVPWVPRLGGRARLRPDLEEIARTGRWDRSRYAGRSEARMAVIGSLVVRGWRLAEVEAAITGGAWKGLAQLYERRSEPRRRERLLPLEWRKSIGYLGRTNSAVSWLTSKKITPPLDPGGEGGFGLIRSWVTGTGCAAADSERVHGWGRRAIAVRQLLAAIGQAAMVSRSCVLEFGTRNLSLQSGLSQRTVSRLLVMLRNEPDPLIDLMSARQMARADRYALRIPDCYVESVRWRRRRAGRIEGIHPAFLVLGGPAALVYQVLESDPARGTEVARSALLSRSAASAALQLLAEHGLAERGPGGWRRGPVALADVAESIGAADTQREREERYRKDRESWRARLRTYQGARPLPVSPRDGWWSLDDGDEYDEMCRWPVLSDDFVRGPPSAERRESA